MRARRGTFGFSEVVGVVGDLSCALLCKVAFFGVLDMLVVRATWAGFFILTHGYRGTVGEALVPQPPDRGTLRDFDAWLVAAS